MDKVEGGTPKISCKKLMTILLKANRIYPLAFLEGNQAFLYNGYLFYIRESFNGRGGEEFIYMYEFAMDF